MYGLNTFHDNLILGMLNGVHSNHAPHAYLFTGNSGRGQNEAAKILSYSLVCEHRENAPCMHCHECLQAIEGINKDIKYVRPEKDKKQISIELIRELVTDMAIKPYGGRAKIYIIEDASQLNNASQNALLKSLEEPPEYITFIMMAENEDVLLPTILSRCTKVAFPPVGEAELLRYVKESFPLYSDDAKGLALYSEGNPTSIQKLLEDDTFSNIRTIAIKVYSKIISTKRLDSFDVEEFADANKEDFDAIIDIWTMLSRDAIMICVGEEDRITNYDVKDELRSYASKYEAARFIKCISALTRAKEMVGRHISAKAIAMNVCLSVKGEGE